MVTNPRLLHEYWSNMYLETIPGSSANSRPSTIDFLDVLDTTNNIHEVLGKKKKKKHTKIAQSGKTKIANFSYFFRMSNVQNCFT